MIFEACTGNYLEAIKAEVLKADRIELCDNLLEGGTTPSLGTIKKCVKDIKIPINVIIRPRGGDFVFTDEEKEIMIIDIEQCVKEKVNGVVIGALLPNNKIDIDFVKRAKEKAKGLEITFHMAFDEINNKKEAIDELVSLNIDRILTKGGIGTALDNLDTLKELIDYAKERIIILPGAGITKDNRGVLIKATGAKEVHGTKVVGSLK